MFMSNYSYLAPTWKDILPARFCSSPVSGWKADLYSCMARITCRPGVSTVRQVTAANLTGGGAGRLLPLPVLLQQLPGRQQLRARHQAQQRVRHPGEMSEPAGEGGLVPQRLVHRDPLLRHGAAPLLCTTVLHSGVTDGGN